MQEPIDPPRVAWSTRAWAEALAGLPADGPLPARTALVPRERVAHGLRRELIGAGQARVLAGTRFIPTAVAAHAVLQEARVPFEAGEEARRPARLQALFRAGLPLEHFPIGLLRARPGWDEAVAHTLTDLEAAGLRPGDLAGHADPRLRDVARMWQAADESAGPSWTLARIYQEAAAVLDRSADAWPFPGPTLGPPAATPPPPRRGSSAPSPP